MDSMADESILSFLKQKLTEEQANRFSVAERKFLLDEAFDDIDALKGATLAQLQRPPGGQGGLRVGMANLLLEAFGPGMVGGGGVGSGGGVIKALQDQIQQMRVSMRAEADRREKTDMKVEEALKRFGSSNPKTQTLQQCGRRAMHESVVVNLFTLDQTQGQAWELAAMHSWALAAQGQLLEDGPGGVQELLSTLISALPADASRLFKIVDVHTQSSVCGPDLKPDFVICSTRCARPTPVVTSAVLDVKPQTKPLLSDKNIGQVINYGQNLLESLPIEIHRSILVGLTDLRTIMWFRIKRLALGEYSYEKGVESPNVAASICGVLRLSPEQTGVSLPSIIPSWDLQHALDIVDILGQGSSSIVFSIVDPHDCGRAPLAAKWNRSSSVPRPRLKDVSVLKDLNCRGPRPGVPQLIDECRDGTLLMSPIGQSITTDCLDLYRSLKLGSQLCNILKLSHLAGWLNRDVRPCNIVLASPSPNAVESAQSGMEQSDPAGDQPKWDPPPWPRTQTGGRVHPPEVAYLIDWGTAIRSDAGPTLYEGGLQYASRRLLLELSSAIEQPRQGGGSLQLEVGGQPRPGSSSLALAATGSSWPPVQYRAADDLISLVRSMFALRHPNFKLLLEASAFDNSPASTAREALRLWDLWLGEGSGRMTWQAAEVMAEACDYDGLGSALDALLE